MQLRQQFRRLFFSLLAACSYPQADLALAGTDEYLEQQFDEARAEPIPGKRKGNWIFVPIPVANPTMGNGLQLAAIFLHPKKAGEEDSPGATSGAGAMATDTDSWLAGVFHDASISKDRFRMNAFAGAGQFNLQFYGLGETGLPGVESVPYRIGGVAARLRGEARVPGTRHWFAGLTYLYLDSNLVFKTTEVVPGLPVIPSQFRSAALGPIVTYDSRDSNYFPLHGQYFRASWSNYGPNWGGEFDYDKLDVFYNHYIPLAAQAVLALRVRFQAASEGTPFFDLPTLDMRGFSRDRYRDSRTISMTAEWRYKFLPRWGVVAFVEAGRLAPTVAELTDGRTITSFGGGVRRQVTKDRDMNIGLDFAISTDDSAVFIQIGERF
jgi:hypothetical protein